MKHDAKPKNAKKDAVTFNQSFISFLKDKEQRIDWIIILVCCLIGYIVIRICYPMPAAMSDSVTYVDAAMRAQFSYFRPYGYSYFLQIVHMFSSSIYAVAFVQMLLYFISVSMFAFVIKKVYPPTNKLFWFAMLVFLTFSPMAFYMINALMSDLLFAVMIYFMLAAFVYFYKTQNWVSLGLFFLFLFFTLHLRYSAIIFPVVLTVCLLFIKNYKRWVAIGGIALFSFIFYEQVKSDMAQETGFNQFSTGFDGWQLANNGMHVIPFIDPSPEKIEDQQMRQLHEYIVTYKDTILKKTENGTNPSAHFIWHNNLPLKQYMMFYRQNTNASYQQGWIGLGSGLYKKYGNYLIWNHPIEFMKHYCLPNAKQVFYPSKTEFMTYYEPIAAKEVKEWYHISPNTDMGVKYPIYKNFVGGVMPIVYLLTWIMMIALGIFSLVKRKELVWHDVVDRNIFLSLVLVGIIYYAATVYASPIALRFWIPMNVIQFAVIYILGNRILEWKGRK